MNQKELITNLERKVQKYEQKIRDLIEAYKTLQKEKDVLQETIKSLSNKASNSATTDGASGGNDDEITALKVQVSKLSRTISTLNEDKKKMEKKFQEDKKITREDNEQEKSRLLNKVNSTKSKFDQMKKENNRLLSELDKLKCSVQFLSKTKLENEIKLDELKTTVSDQKSAIGSLTQKLQDYRAVKEDLEGQVMSASVSNEDRVAQLEAAVSELSRSIGELQIENQNHLETISKQQDRIKCMHQEMHQLSQQPNKSPHSRTRTQSDTPDILQVVSASDRCSNIDQSERSIQKIIDQMSLLRVQLSKLDPNLDIISVISPSTSRSMKNAAEMTGDWCENAECVELRDEYNRIIRNKEESSPVKEVSQLKERVSELNQEMYSLEMVSAQNINVLKDTILKNEYSHKQEINQLKQENSRMVSDIQSELTKHRNRTINLLSEKDLEMSHMAKQLEKAQLELRLRHHSNGDDSGNTASSNTVTKDNKEDSWYDASVKMDQSCPLYQCCETKARLEKEVRRLHQYKRQLESQLHKLKADLEYIKADFTTQLQQAKQQHTRQSHRHSNKTSSQLQNSSHLSDQPDDCAEECSATINMEYLKNVFRTFLQTDEIESRKLMAKAIGRVLDFSDSEITSIDKTKNFRL